MKIVIVIPARYNSSRFPGKPLAEIIGEPMIVRVSRLCSLALKKSLVFVATDDQRIKDVVEKAGFNVVMTQHHHPTGTDRVAEVSELIDADIYINVQGDEPLVDPNEIKKVINEKVKHPDSVIKAYTKILSNEDPEDVNTPKVIFNNSKQMVYMSRQKIPGSKTLDLKPKDYYKAVCIYAFNKNELKAFKAYGKKSDLEKAEDIEILRFLDLGLPVRLVETKSISIAVDRPDDIKKVEEFITSSK